MPKFKIQAQHTVYITYVVEGDSFKEARDKLYNRELFTQWSNGDGQVFGPTEAYDDVKVDWEATGQGPHYDSDPSPTGHQSVRRDWEWDVICEQCGESTGHWEETILLCDDCDPEDAQETV